MIIAQKKAFLTGLNAVDADWLLYNFAGVEPTKESEFPFDISDELSFIANAQSAMSVKSSLKDDKYIKFLFDEALLSQKGLNPEGYGIVCSNLITNATIKIEERMKMMSGVQGSGLMARTYSGDYYEFHLGANLEVDKLVLKFSSTSYDLREYDIEYWDGNAWVVLHTHSGASSDVHEYSIMQTTDKLRIMTKFDSSSNGVEFDIIRIIGTGNGEVVPDVSTTWSLLVPKDYSSFDALRGDSIPFLYCSSSGPNAGGDVIITNANPAKGEAVRLINFSVKSELVEF